MIHILRKYNQYIILGLFVLAVLFFLALDLNPWHQTMFEFHDVTQPARIQQFSLNLVNFNIPPRIAPNFSFDMSYPVFNFYAPFTYWISSTLNLLGFNVVASLKLSFIAALILAFISAYVFLRNNFKFYPALFGSVIYASSLYFAIDIFIRGNLGETWFIAVLPLALYFLQRHAKKNTKSSFITAILVMAAALSVHNILSLLFIPVIIIFILLLPNKKLNFLILGLAVLLNSYYFIPLIVESSLTHAAEIAKTTVYSDHFLCPWQLWNSTWGYGGSVKGCVDGMPFKIGKPQLIFLILGLGTYLFLLITKKTKEKRLPIFFGILTIVSLFLTTELSTFIWKLFEPIASVIQFPWRLIAFSLIGIAYFASYLWENISVPFKKVIILIISIAILINHSKYFTKPQISQKVFEQKYVSMDFIKKSVVYNIAEYLPSTADFVYWKEYGEKVNQGTEIPSNQPVIVTDSTNVQVNENSNFTKAATVKNETEVLGNIHYFPTWKIIVNDKQITPKYFDELGRPKIVLDPTITSTVKIVYGQTLVEILGNSLSILVLICMLLSIRQPLWHKIQKMHS